MTGLVTGRAGFIGYNDAARMLARGEEGVGLDVGNGYCDVALTEAAYGA